MPYFWCIELYSDVERKLSIGRRKIVGASGCVANEIRIVFILEKDEPMVQRPEGHEMTYRDSVLGKNTLELRPHPRHRLPVPISRRGCKYSKREFGYLKLPGMSSTAVEERRRMTL
jgi:hypothetical protein